MQRHSCLRSYQMAQCAILFTNSVVRNDVDGDKEEKITLADRLLFLR